MKNIDWNSVEEAQEYKSLPAGGYICEITAAEDVEEKEYLRLEYDIQRGDFAGYWRNLYENKGFWGGHFIRSYKETARGFFKAFITALQESNPGYTFNNDERSLVGKAVGLVLYEEEYLKNDGSVGTRLTVDRPRSVKAILSGDFKVPDKKVLAGSKTPEFTPIDDDDVPFK